MKRLPVYLLLANLLVGCALPNLSLPGVSGAGSGTSQPVEPLNGISFTALTAENAKYLSAGVIAAGGGNLSASSSSSAGAAMAAPASVPQTTGAAMAPGAAPAGSAPQTAVRAPAPMPAPSAGPANGSGGAVSGNVYSYYGYGNYFNGGDPTQSMNLVSITQAQTKGSSGSFTEIIKTIVGPIVKAWAKDGRLTNSNATLNSDGTPVVNPSAAPGPLVSGAIYGGGYGGANGWQFVYASSSRSEVLNFTVTPDKTTIIRMRWAPLDLSPDLVTVDATSAIKKLEAAIADKTFKGAEEKTGNDYFLGFPYTQNNFTPWNGQNVQVLYQVPSTAQWNVSLESILGKVVWELSWYQNGNVYGKPMPGPIMESGVAVSAGAGVASAGTAVAAPALLQAAPTQPSVCWTDNNGQGMVDAETGTVIRFTRPTETLCGMPTPYGSPIAMPSPLPPKLVPSPAPTVAASASAAPNTTAQ